MKQVQQEANLVNARALIEVCIHDQLNSPEQEEILTWLCAQKLQENCFEKCVPKPGSSLSSSETTCMTSCMEKYMAAWNMVNSAYIARLKQESGH